MIERDKAAGTRKVKLPVAAEDALPVRGDDSGTRRTAGRAGVLIEKMKCGITFFRNKTIRGILRANSENEAFAREKNIEQGVCNTARERAHGFRRVRHALKKPNSRRSVECVFGIAICGRDFLIYRKLRTEMSPQEQSSVENQGFSSPSEILSDEEIRSRAAAYAQRIFEQQMEAYEAQRAQAIAMMRAQEEYARQKAAYEEACREYYAQQGQVAVRVDAETGEEIYSELQNQYASSAESFPADRSEEIPEAMPAEDPSSPEPEPEMPDVYGKDPNFLYSESAYAEAPAEEIPEEIPSEISEDPQGEPAPSPRQEAVAVPVAPAPSPFPWFAVIVSIFCVSVIAAVGYILFSGDPRFEHQRKHFLAALNLAEKSEPEPSAKPARTGTEIPDFGASRSESVPETVIESAAKPPVPAPDAEVPAEDESLPSDEEIPSEKVAEEMPADEDVSSSGETVPEEEEEELFEDDESWLDD